MGNEASFNQNKYFFIDCNSHGVNWHEKSVYLVDNVYTAFRIQFLLQRCNTLFVDCEGENFGNLNAEIGLVQIADSSDRIVLFDVKSCPSILSVIKELMEDESIVKVFHDCSGDAAALYLANFDEQRGIRVKNAFDVQTAQVIREGAHSAYCLGDLYKRVVGKEFPKVNTKTFGSNKWLDKRPMSENMVKYATVDVMVLPEIYDAQICSLTAYELQECTEQTKEKLKWKIKNLERTHRPDTRRSEEQGTELASGIGTGLAVGAAIGIGLGALALLFGGKNKNK